MNKKDFYWVIASLIVFPLCSAVGTVMVVLSKGNRFTAFGWFFILTGAFFLILLLLRIPVILSALRDRKYRQRITREQEKAFNDALAAFQRNDYPELNTVRIVNEGIEFFAEGRYVCESNFNNVSGNHFAFEIIGAKLKYMPETYCDVCNLAENGVLVEAGYFERKPLDDAENDNGIILKDAPEKLVGQTVTLKQNNGYNLYIWTADGDEIDFGFLKILKCEDDVLTVYFSLNVSAGLCDTVEGTVELKRDASADTADDIHTLIDVIKRRPYNAIELSDGQIEAILQANPFLPESYVEFLKKVGFADLDWIDVGRNADTPTNLYRAEEESYVKQLLSASADYNLDDFYFFAVDASDSYYAFSRNNREATVYAFSNDAPFITHYENFEKFLSEILRA